MSKTPEWITAFRAVRAERLRQDKKWGEQNHVYYKWATILGEEYGEVCRATFESSGNLKQIYEEASHVAAVAVAIMENVLRDEQLYT